MHTDAVRSIDVAALALAGLVGAVSGAGANPASHAMIEFTGKVTTVESLGARARTALVVDVDPRFVIVVHVRTVSGADAPFAAGDDQAFAIHSPTRLFASDHPAGGTFAFVLVKTLARGKTTWQLALKR
jgi:hypothetical protein